MSKYNEFSDEELLLIKFKMWTDIDEYERGEYNSKSEYLTAKKLYQEINTELKLRGNIDD